MVKNPKYQMYKGGKGKFFFRLRARNGQIILRSQGYSGKAGCRNGMESVRKNSGEDARYERRETRGGKFYFNLLAKNKQVIGTSEMYKTQVARDNGIASVKTNGPKANVEEV